MMATPQSVLKIKSHDPPSVRRQQRIKAKAIPKATKHLLKIKAEDGKKYEEHKKKDKDRKVEYRKKQKDLMKNNLELLKEKRLADKLRQQKRRAKVKNLLTDHTDDNIPSRGAGGDSRKAAKQKLRRKADYKQLVARKKSEDKLNRMNNELRRLRRQLEKQTAKNEALPTPGISNGAPANTHPDSIHTADSSNGALHRADSITDTINTENSEVIYDVTMEDVRLEPGEDYTDLVAESDDNTDDPMGEDEEGGTPNSGKFIWQQLTPRTKKKVASRINSLEEEERSPITKQLRKDVRIRIERRIEQVEEETEFQKQVEAFFMDDQNSSPVPDKKKAGFRYRLCYLHVLHHKFMADTGVDCSYSHFCRMVPSYVIRPKPQDWGTCLCILCLNPELKLEALKKTREFKKVCLSIEEIAKYTDEELEELISKIKQVG